MKKILMILMTAVLFATTACASGNSDGSKTVSSSKGATDAKGDGSMTRIKIIVNGDESKTKR